MTVDEITELLMGAASYARLLAGLDLRDEPNCEHCTRQRKRTRAWARERAAQIVQVHRLEIEEVRRA